MVAKGAALRRASHRSRRPPSTAPLEGSASRKYSTRPRHSPRMVRRPDGGVAVRVRVRVAGMVRRPDGGVAVRVRVRVRAQVRVGEGAMAVDAVCAHLMFTTHLHTDDCQRNERIMHSSIRNTQTNHSLDSKKQTNRSLVDSTETNGQRVQTTKCDKCSNVTLDKWAKHFSKTNRV